MKSLTSILTAACIATTSGVVWLGKHLKESDPTRGVVAYLHGDTVDNDGYVTSSHTPLYSPDLIQTFGVETDPELVEAASRHREIYTEALMTEVDETEPVGLRRNRNHHRARSGGLTRGGSRLTPDIADAGIFAQSRRGQRLSRLGVLPQRTYLGTPYTGQRLARDRQAYSPTGNRTIFERSRFHKQHGTKYKAYQGRVRRLEQRRP